MKDDTFNVHSENTWEIKKINKDYDFLGEGEKSFNLKSLNDAEKDIMSKIDQHLFGDDLFEKSLVGGGLQSYPATWIAEIIKLPIFRSFPWSHTRDNCLAFCYPKVGEPFIIKGEANIVKNFLMLNGQPIVAHLRIYGASHKPKTIVFVYGLRENVKIKISNLTRNNPLTGLMEPHQRCWIVVSDKSTENKLFWKKVRQIPRKWIAEFDPFINEDANLTPLTTKEIKQEKVEVKPVELTEEEKAALAKKKSFEAAVKMSRNKTLSILMRVGAIPSIPNMDVYEIKEKE